MQMESKEEPVESKPDDEEPDKADDNLPAKKRKKRKGLLSTHIGRSKYSQNDLSWIQNTKHNQVLAEQKRL